MIKFCFCLIIGIDALISVATVHSAVLIGKVVERVQMNGGMEAKDYVIRYSMTMALIMVLWLIKESIKIIAYYKEVYSLRKKCADSIVNAELSWVEGQKAGNIQIIMNRDIYSASGYYLMGVETIATKVLLVITSLIQLFEYDSLIVVIAIPLIVAVIFLQRLCSKPVQPKRMEFLQCYGDNQGFYTNLIRAYILIKIENATECIWSKFEERLEAIIDAYKRIEPVLVCAIVSGALIAVIPMAFIMTRSMLIYRNGLIDLSNLIAILMLSTTIFGVLLEITQQFASLEGRKASIERVNQIMNAPKEAERKCWSIVKNSEEVLAMERISFSYGKKEVIKDCSLEFLRGKNYLLLGGNGQGKTTLIRLMLSLYIPNSGSIRTETKTLKELRSRVSYVDQQNFFIDGTVLENITFGVELYKKKFGELNIGKVFNKLPQGIETYISDEDFKLSGGQMKCMQVARGLVKNSDVYVFDEPLANVDKEAEALIISDLRKVAEDPRKTLVVISHDLDVLEAEIDFIKYRIAGGQIL